MPLRLARRDGRCREARCRETADAWRLAPPAPSLKVYAFVAEDAATGRAAHGEDR